MSPTVTFVDREGKRYPNVELPASLLKEGVSLRRREAYLKETGQLPGDPLPDMQEPQEVVEIIKDRGIDAALERRLSALEARPETVLPSDASLAEWSRQAARVSLSHKEIAAVADQAVATCEAAAKGADDRLTQLDEQQQSLISTVSEAVSEAQQGVAAAVQQLQQQGASALADIEAQALTSAQEIARRQRGPQGLAGAGVVIAPEDPSKTDDESYGTRWFGRALVEGDGVLQVGKDGITIWRRAGGSWLKSSELAPKTELVNQQLSVLDKSSHTMTTQTIVGTGGGSGSGGEKLLINRAGVGGGSIQLATSDNWAGVSDPKAGELILDLRGLDGAMTGKSGFMVAAFTWDGTDEWTEYALIGELHDVITVELSIQRGGAVAPSGVTVTIPPGAQALRIFMRVLAKPGTSGAVNNVSVAGSVEWAHESLARAQDARTPGPQPLWIYV